jgi:hypothetical protein
MRIHNKKVGVSADFGGEALEWKKERVNVSPAKSWQRCRKWKGVQITIKPVALIINDKKEVRIEQLNVEHLKFERLQYQLPYKSPSQPSSEESP